MEEKSRAQELSVREISLIRELAQIRKEHKRELEYEKFDGYELPPRTQFSMLNKPAVSIKYGVMKFNMACIRLFEGIKYVLPILHPNKKRLALIMCPEEDSASVEWARRKDENWVNKDITSLEFVENIFRLMNWNRECRYKVLGRVANSDQGLCMLFDLEEAIMFTPKPQEYTDPLTGEMKKKQMKFFPDAYKNRIGKSYNDYIADHQMNMFEVQFCLSYILSHAGACAGNRRTQFQQTVINTGVSGILRFFQLRQGQVRGDDQWFPAAVAAVDDVINLLQSCRMGSSCHSGLQ